MKKILLLLYTLFAALTICFSQVDSSFHRVSIRVYIPEVHLPIANKYYGMYFGQGGIGVIYHFNRKVSIELRSCTLDSLPMIDAKDTYPREGGAWTPLPPSPYLSYNGGSLTFFSLGLNIKYDFFQKGHVHLYGDAGLSFVSAKAKAITTYDVLIRNNPPVDIYHAEANGSFVGADINIGGAYYFKKHWNTFLETGYEILATKQPVSPSAISIYRASLGLEYSF